MPKLIVNSNGSSPTLEPMPSCPMFLLADCNAIKCFPLDRDESQNDVILRQVDQEEMRSRKEDTLYLTSEYAAT